MTDTVATSTLRLHAAEQGSKGPTLVFLHYYGGSSRTWDPVIRALPSGQRTLAVDLRGWGESAKPADGHTLATYADDVQALLASKAITDYVLVGHSMGGKVAQLLASRHPAGLRGLILVAPATPTPLALPPDVLAGFVHVYESRASIEGALRDMLVTHPLTAELHEQVIADSLRGAQAAKAAWPLVMSQEDISAAVAGITVPALVMSGSGDKVDPVEAQKAHLLPLLRHVEFHVLPEHGHLLPLEAPADVARLIATWLSAHA